MIIVCGILSINHSYFVCLYAISRCYLKICITSRNTWLPLLPSLFNCCLTTFWWDRCSICHPAISTSKQLAYVSSLPSNEYNFLSVVSIDQLNSCFSWIRSLLADPQNGCQPGDLSLTDTRFACLHFDSSSFTVYLGMFWHQRWGQFVFLCQFHCQFTLQ